MDARDRCTGHQPAPQYPDGVPERAALWRSELAFRRAIVVLDNAHLLEESTPGRYRQHDLLREHALDPEDDLPDCLTRLLDYYVETASAAVSVVHPELSR